MLSESKVLEPDIEVQGRPILLREEGGAVNLHICRAPARPRRRHKFRVKSAPVRRYQLLRAGLPTAEKRVVRRYLVPQSAVVLAVVLISCAIAARNSNSTAEMTVFAVIAGLYFTYAAFVSPRHARKKLAKGWETQTGS